MTPMENGLAFEASISHASKECEPRPDTSIECFINVRPS